MDAEFIHWLMWSDEICWLKSRWSGSFSFFFLFSVLSMLSLEDGCVGLVVLVDADGAMGSHLLVLLSGVRDAPVSQEHPGPVCGTAGPLLHQGWMQHALLMKIVDWIGMQR